MTDINIGAITESLNYKSDLDLGNTSPQLVDYIVEQQLPSADNNYTWYDLYRSGKVVQGGKKTTDGIITLPIPMENDEYGIIFGCNYYTSNAGTPVIVYYDQTPTSFKAQGRWNGSANSSVVGYWQVSGMSAGV